MAAVRRRTRHEPGKVTDYTGVRPPTDVMVITSLPRYTRHLPPGAATRHLKWNEDGIDDRGTSLVTGDGHQGISHSGLGIPAIGSREPEAGS